MATFHLGAQLSHVRKPACTILWNWLDLNGMQPVLMPLYTPLFVKRCLLIWQIKHQFNSHLQLFYQENECHKDQVCYIVVFGALNNSQSTQPPQLDHYSQTLSTQRPQCRTRWQCPEKKRLQSEIKC